MHTAVFNRKTYISKWKERNNTWYSTLILKWVPRDTREHMHTFTLPRYAHMYKIKLKVMLFSHKNTAHLNN